jgi:YD repeat-containing protein
MKQVFYILILSFISVSADAQYFYKDIELTRQMHQKYKALKNAGIRSINLISLEADGSPTEGFSGSQSIDGNYRHMTTTMSTPITPKSFLENWFDAEGRLIKTVDSTDGSKSVSEYSYDNNGKLSRISNYTSSVGKVIEKEEHHWKTDGSGKYTSMTRIRNDKDSSFYNFLSDENGNIIEETGRRGQNALPTVFYYYDDQNRLTDVVRYSKKASRLLPDFVMDYDDASRIKSLMIIPEGSDDYQRWIYQYNDKGLRTKEIVFNKRKQQLGSIEYNYSTRPGS